MARKIALAGRIGSGKTSVANALVRFHNYRSISVAGALRWELSDLLKVPIDTFTAPETKETWRRLLQEWGQARRRLQPDYWAKRLVSRIKMLEEEHLGRLPLVVDDVRFRLEVEALAKLDVTVIFLDTPRAQSVQYLVETKGVDPLEAESLANDVSECELPNTPCAVLPPHFDVKAPRTEPVESLYRKVCEIAGLEPKHIGYDQNSKIWKELSSVGG